MDGPFASRADGPPAGRGTRPGVRLGVRASPDRTVMHGFPSVAAMREQAAVDAARVMKPFAPALVFVACALFIAALTLGFVAAAEADRAIELQERV
jgi:hypothetical protein